MDQKSICLCYPDDDSKSRRKLKVVFKLSANLFKSTFLRYSVNKRFLPSFRIIFPNPFGVDELKNDNLDRREDGDDRCAATLAWRPSRPLPAHGSPFSSDTN